MEHSIQLRETAHILSGPALLPTGTDLSTDMVFDKTSDESDGENSMDETHVVESKSSFKFYARLGHERLSRVNIFQPDGPPVDLDGRTL